MRTLTERLPGLFAARPTRLLALRPDERLERYLGDHGARLDVPGEADAIVSSDLPLRVAVAGERRPVDLVLVDGGDFLAPQTPLVPVAFAKALSGGLSVSGGVRVRVDGADGEAVARQVGQHVVYANALRDADVLAMAVPTGLEAFVQLRSADSPRELGLEFDLPAGARLEPEVDAGRTTGAISIVRGRTEIARVGQTTATDATGEPVDVSATVVGSTLRLSVQTTADTAYPVMVDPIIEGQWNNPKDPNGGFVYTRGWRRDSSVGIGGFAWAPNADDPSNGTTCLRVNTHNPLVIEPINNAICVSTFPALNYPLSLSFQSIGAWTWRPPAGIRSSANDVPAPNTDAFLYRADVRTGYVDLQRAGGNSAFVGGLISGRTHNWIGTAGIVFTTGQSTGSNSPFLLDFSNSSFFGTYCARSDCSAELNDPVYDGTYVAVGVWVGGTGQQASTLAQGAAVSVRSPRAVGGASSALRRDAVVSQRHVHEPCDGDGHGHGHAAPGDQLHRADDAERRLAVVPGHVGEPVPGDDPGADVQREHLPDARGPQRSARRRDRHHRSHDVIRDDRRRDGEHARLEGQGRSHCAHGHRGGRVRLAVHGQWSRRHRRQLHPQRDGARRPLGRRGSRLLGRRGRAGHVAGAVVPEPRLSGVGDWELHV